MQGPGRDQPAGRTDRRPGRASSSARSRGRRILNGFYLEEAADTQDGNALTSEGIFVFANSPAVNVGDRVRIRGTVAEFSSATGSLVSNLTELGATSNATVCSTGNPLPPPATISLPVDSVSDFERYEGMLVQFTQQLVVTGTFNLGHVRPDRSRAERALQPTQTPGTARPGPHAADLNARSLISLDDGSTSSNANLNGGGLAPIRRPA